MPQMPNTYLLALSFGLLLLAASVQSDSFALNEATSFSTLNTYLGAQTSATGSLSLVNTTGTSGVAIYPTSVQVHLGFSTTFVWTTSSCSNSTNLLSKYAQYTDGVTFFATKTYPTTQKIQQSESLLGVAQLDDAFIVAYVTALNEFYVCNWQTAPLVNASYFRRNCQIYPNIQRRFSCDSHTFTLTFDNNAARLKVFVDGASAFEHKMDQVLDAAPRFIGLSAGNDVFPRQQDINSWKWQQQRLLAQLTQATTWFFPSGTAKVLHSNAIQLTSGDVPNASGLVIANDLVNVVTKFSTKFVWRASACDLQYGGGEGFSFFLMKNGTFGSGDSSANSGSALGVLYLPNITMIGYSLVNNAFYVCKWSNSSTYVSLATACSPLLNPGPRLSCDQDYTFELQYYDGLMKIFINGAYIVGNFFTVDSDIYRVGFSGSTGYSTANQTITKWQMDDLSAVYSNTEPYNSASLVAFNSAVISTNLVLTQMIPIQGSTPRKIGSAVSNKLFPANEKFSVSLAWIWSNIEYYCSTEDQFDGFTFFVTTDPQAIQPHNVSYTNIGLKNLQNVLMVTYSLQYNSVSVCYWLTHNGDDGIDLRLNNTYCSSIMLSSNRPCAKPGSSYKYNFEFVYTGQTLMMYLGDYFAKYSVALPTGLYYAGVMGVDRGRSSIVVTEWKVQRGPLQKTDQYDLSFATHKSDVALYGNGSFIGDTVNIPPSNLGLVLHSVPVPAHLGFTVSFTFRVVCGAGSSSAFSFFITKTKPSSNMTLATDMSTGRIGLASVPEIALISVTSSNYIAYFNMGNAHYLGSPISQGWTCGNAYNFTFNYSEKNLFLNYIGASQISGFTNRPGLVLDPSFYYIGLSGIGSQFSNWKFSFTSLHQRSFSAFSLSNTNLVGSASIVGGKLRLTSVGGESGVGVSSSRVYAHTGFNSTLTWTPSNCDSTYNGADGFSLFFSKNIPTAAQVAASGGGLLGIGSVPDVITFGYSATYNAFYVCNWASPLDDDLFYVCNVVVSAPGLKMTCPNAYVFSYSYDHNVFKLSVNGTQQLTAPLIIEPVPYFVGLSGATGGGYFQQDVSDWSFESITL